MMLQRLAREEADQTAGQIARHLREHGLVVTCDEATCALEPEFLT
jgi:ABC-type methionine transport system ATPase subunit